MHHRTVYAFALLWICSHTAIAQDLTAPFAFENAQVLPTGVRNVRFFDMFMTMDNRYSRSGVGQIPLGFLLNKPVKWSDVYQEQRNQVENKMIQSILKDNGVSEDGVAGYATGVVNTFVDVKVPVFAIALGSKFTAAVAVPIVNVDVSVDTGFIQSSDGQAFVSAACKLSPDKCNEAAHKLNNATKQKLDRLAYQPLRSETISGIGDIQLMGKYQLLSDSASALASKLVLTLPTGTQSNPDKAVDITTGDLRYKLGAMVIYDYRLIPSSRWNVYGSYTALLPSQMVRRLPTSADDPLSADKEEVTRNWGHWVSMGTSIDYTLDRAGLTLTTGYSFQFLSQTHYTGSGTDDYTLYRYALLDDLEPSEVLHCVTATLGFSTVQWYLRKEFFLPFEVNVTYSKPFAGRYAPLASVVAGEAVFFF